MRVVLYGKGQRINVGNNHGGYYGGLNTFKALPVSFLTPGVSDFEVIFFN